MSGRAQVSSRFIITPLVATIVLLVTVSAALGKARTCSDYTARRLARFVRGAERGVDACLRRSAHDGAPCPDARLNGRLGYLHRATVHALDRRCPDAGAEHAVSVAEADVLCRKLAICPPPTRTPVLDAGWTAVTHGLAVPEGAKATVDLTDCDGVTDTLCDVHGATSGTAFGAPTPISGGGIATCMTVAFASDLTGTFDLVTGDFTETSALRVVYYRGESDESPCPVCMPVDGDSSLGETGTCQLGPNAGAPCTVDGLAGVGYGPSAATSTDCPPDPAKLIGDFRSTVTATTGTASFGLSPDSPRCSGNATEHCLCDTCNTAEASTCTSNADCPDSGGAPGICGGRRCLGGATSGMPCSSDSQCDGGSCGRPGEPTRPNACAESDEGPGPLCEPVSSESGECAHGPIDQICARQPHRGCLVDADCQPPIGVIAGDVCVSRTRPCFLDPIVTTGARAVPVGHVAHPVLAGTLCLGPSSRADQNVVTGLPGPARFVWPIELTLGN